MSKPDDLAHNRKFLIAAFRGENQNNVGNRKIKKITFEGFDKNGDGKISMKEFLEVKNKMTLIALWLQFVRNHQ